MEQLRFITNDYTYADFSTSLSPAVERALEERKSTSTVVLNIFHEDSFTVGYFDDPEKTIDISFCKEHGIVLRRRKNAGGAVFGAKGSAFICMYLDTGLPWVPIKTIREAFPYTLTKLSDTLNELFNIKSAYRPLNDVEIDGRKLCASSAGLEHNILTLRLLVNALPTNRDLITRALITPIEKLKDKKIKSVGQRFTCLEEETRKKISTSELIKITEVLVDKVFGKNVSLLPGELNELEQDYANTYQEEFTSTEWFYANSERLRFKDSPPDAVKTEGLHKAPAGLIRVTLLVRRDKIHDIIITGDFHPSPYRIVRDMEDALRGKSISTLEIKKEITDIFNRTGTEMAGVEIDDFLTAFKKSIANMQTDKINIRE